MNGTPSTVWQTGFLNVLPAVQTHATIQFRHLPLEQREDLIQESIASACVAYQRLAAQGKLHLATSSSLATYAVKQARGGRHVGGHQDAAKDVMSPVCQRRRGLHVFSYHQYPLLPRSDHGESGWKQLVIANRNDSIPDTAAFRIDFERWLRTLTRRDRRMIAAFIRGDRTLDVADRFGVTEGRVSQLRRRYEQDWRAFQRHAA